MNAREIIEQHLIILHNYFDDMLDYLDLDIKSMDSYVDLKVPIGGEEVSKRLNFNNVDDLKEWFMICNTGFANPFKDEHSKIQNALHDFFGEILPANLYPLASIIATDVTNYLIENQSDYVSRNQ